MQNLFVRYYNVIHVHGDSVPGGSRVEAGSGAAKAQDSVWCYDRSTVRWWTNKCRCYSSRRLYIYLPYV